ncbi:MAG: hypothetical protein U0354_04310 [Candidatus Sericytochromatia bacterium]
MIIRNKNSYKGFSLVTTLLFSTTTFLLIGGFLYSITGDNKNIIKQKNSLNATAIANQGIEHSIDYLNRLNNFTENPLSTVTNQTNFNTILGTGTNATVSTFTNQFTNTVNGSLSLITPTPFGKQIPVTAVLQQTSSEFPELLSTTTLLKFPAGNKQRGEFVVGIEPASTSNVTIGSTQYQLVKSYIPNRQNPLETKKIMVVLRREISSTPANAMNNAIISDSSFTIPNGYVIDASETFGSSGYSTDTSEGGLFSNGSITIANGGQSDVDGNVNAVGTVSGDLSNVTGTTNGSQSSQALPNVVCPVNICGVTPEPAISTVGPSWPSCTVTTTTITGASNIAANGGNNKRTVITSPSTTSGCKISGDYNSTSNTTTIVDAPVYLTGNWHDEESTNIVMAGNPNAMIYSTKEIHTKGAWPTTGSLSNGTFSTNPATWDSTANENRNRLLFYSGGGEMVINANYPNNWPSDGGNTTGGGSPNKNLVEGMFYMNSTGNEFKILGSNLKILGGFILKPEAGHSNFTGANNYVLRDKGATWGFLKSNVVSLSIPAKNLTLATWKELK